MNKQITLEHIMEVDDGAGVFIEFTETDGGGCWWEFVFIRDGKRVFQSEQMYGNPVAAARDGLNYALGDL